MTDGLVYNPAKEDSLRLVAVDVENYAAVLRLKVAEAQRNFVASNAVSLVQGHYHEGAWFRAVYAGEDAVGFVMLHDPRSGKLGDFDTQGALFIWRLMIAEDHQGKGYGRGVLEILKRVARDNGFAALGLSYVEAEGGPGPFYARLGFRKTGRMIEDEVEARLDLG